MTGGVVKHQFIPESVQMLAKCNLVKGNMESLVKKLQWPELLEIFLEYYS